MGLPEAALPALVSKASVEVKRRTHFRVGVAVVFFFPCSVWVAVFLNAQRLDVEEAALVQRKHRLTLLIHLQVSGCWAR